MNRILPLLICLLAVLPLAARKQSVGPAKLRKTSAPEALYDTIYPTEGEIRCAGYDKPNRATRETFFLTNNTADSIDADAICITFEYLDLKNRQLHSVTHTVIIDLPHAQTRNVSIPSWDRNNAFHYELSTAPARRASTPYRVRSRVNYLLRRR